MAWRDFIIGLGFLGLVGCNGGGSSSTDYQSSQKEPSFGDWVIIHMSNDPDRLNPTNSRMVGATYIKALIHTTLLYQNPSDGNNYPYLAKSLPDISADGMRMTFEIRPEAVWDDGKPITAADVVTSFKILLNPKVDAAHLRSYFDFLSDIEIDKDNPKKFTFVANRKYFRALYDLGQTYILPSKNYKHKQKL
jgi:peptide/nickel transport system substrate-binding protein